MSICHGLTDHRFCWAATRLPAMLQDAGIGPFTDFNYNFNGIQYCVQLVLFNSGNICRGPVKMWEKALRVQSWHLETYLKYV